MIFINDNNKLKAYIPNVIKEASGERAYFEKIMPWIQQSEDWLIREIFGSDFTIPEKYMSRSRSIVAFMSLYLALPSLDLVLTPNGFGVVNNQNVAPASRERVERLRSSMLEQRDMQIDSLLEELADDNDWRQSAKGRSINSLFIYPSCFAHGCSYDQYIINLRRAEIPESTLRNDVVSPQLYKRIVNKLPSLWTDADFCLVRHIRAFVNEAINEDPRQNILDEIVRQLIQRLRKNPVAYPEWHASELREIWSPETFENKKNSTGYWF